MNPERKEILNLKISLPGRMNAAEAAGRLGFEPDHISHPGQCGPDQAAGQSTAGAVEIFSYGRD